MLIYQETGENWVDVNLTLSTLESFGQITPSRVRNERRRIEDPRPQVAESGNYASLAEPVVEAPVIIEEAPGRFTVTHEGPGVTCIYPTPVSIASDADAMRLKPGTLTMQADVMAVAVPGYDDTAFLVAKVTNDTGLLYVDGAFAGSTGIRAISAGGEARLNFGPIDGLRLKKVRLDAGEGATGLISRYNQQRKHVRLEVENLSAED